MTGRVFTITKGASGFECNVSKDDFRANMRSVCEVETPAKRAEPDFAPKLGGPTPQPI